MFPSLNLIVLGLALAGPVATWALTAYKGRVDLAAAVSVERDKGKSACDGRVTEIQTKLNNESAEVRRLTDDADRVFAPTPVEAAELADLCNASASCRDRTRKTETKK